MQVPTRSKDSALATFVAPSALAWIQYDDRDPMPRSVLITG